MSVVAIKNLLFPNSKAAVSDRDPLLPTTATTYLTASSSQKPQILIKDSQTCTHDDCPNRLRRNSTESSASSTLTTASSSTHPNRTAWLQFDPRTVSDAIIGLSDGLTVPFALTAGLSAFNDTRVVIYGGCAELIAGSISMGLGGWLAGRGEAEFYTTTHSETRSLVQTSPSQVRDHLYAVFAPYRLPSTSIDPLVQALLKDSSNATEFLMQFHHHQHPSDGDEAKRTPLSSALTIAVGYFLGGGIPLLPYFFVGKEDVMTGLYWSVAVMAVCLFAFGLIKSLVVGASAAGWEVRIRGGVEMVAVGGVAAGAAWSIVRALG